MTDSFRPFDDLFDPRGHVRADVVTEPLARMLADAVEFARRTRWESIRTPHLFMGLIASADPTITLWAEEAELDLGFVLAQFTHLYTDPKAEMPAVIKMHREFLSLNAIRVLRAARARSLSRSAAQISPVDLLVATLEAQQGVVAECFEYRGIEAAKLISLAESLEDRSESLA